jgi:putative iron-regulated protein
MKPLRRLALSLLLLAPLPPTPAGQAADDGALLELQRAAVERYATVAHDLYLECERLALAQLEAVEAFVAAPDAAGLELARRRWLEARRVYGRTEALRFYSGPIDDPGEGVETFLNAWPLDEAYIDAVEGASSAGIIGDPERYPNLSATMLVLLNERGGEANVSIGWHAVEFLLWGQDRSAEGPGARPWTDFQDGGAPHADRRREYLRLCAALLVEHHRKLREAWAPDTPENYRARFLAEDPRASFRKVLAGMTILSGFEMSGERLAVAYETRDQEEEHSCFSDNTHVDFLADQEGILALWRGGDGGELPEGAVGVREVARAASPSLAAQIERDLEATLAAIRAMPVPFDQAILGPDERPARQAVLAALIAIEDQARSLATLGLVLGHDIALQPGG